MYNDPRRPHERFFLAQCRFDSRRENVEEYELSVFSEGLKSVEDLSKLHGLDLLKTGLERLSFSYEALNEAIPYMLEHYCHNGDAVRLKTLLEFIKERKPETADKDVSSQFLEQNDLDKFFGISSAQSWACSMAIHSGSLECVKLLHEYSLLTLGFENSDCASSFELPDDGDIKEAFEEVFAGEIETKKGFSTYLHDAANAGHVEIVEWLLQQPEIELNQKDDRGFTPKDLLISRIDSSNKLIDELKELSPTLENNADKFYCAQEIILLNRLLDKRKNCLKLLEAAKFSNE